MLITFSRTLMNANAMNEELKSAVENLGIKNPVTTIANDLGVSRSNVSSYLNGKIKASDNFLRKFAEFYKIDFSEYSFEESSRTMNFGEPVLNYENSGVPYYDVDFVGGFDVVMNNQKTKPAFYINFPQFNDADCWVNITGKSMSPFISHGDIVALKQVHSWKDFIPFGEIYAIVTDEFRTVKILKKGPDKETFILKPYSKDDSFSEQEIPTRLIRAVFTVRGAMKRFF